MPMTVAKYITDPANGCCTSGELIALNRVDPEGFKKLKEWAKEEMKNKGVEIQEA